MSSPTLTPQQVDQLLEEIQRVRASSLSLDQIDELIRGLPHIYETELTDLGQQESCCPICFTPYLALIAEEELALVMDSPPIGTIGITQLSRPWQCGHMFCRRDISKWIIDGHDSCPLCRHTLVERIQASDPTLPDTYDIVIQANIEELRAQLTNFDGIIPNDPRLPLQRDENETSEFTLPDYDILIQELRAELTNLNGIIPNDPLQRDENEDRGVEYSAMYS